MNFEGMGLDPKLVAAMEREKAQHLNEQKLKAKYKIQIWFKSDRSTKGPIAFSLSAWQSGKRLHGGGDEMMFMCRRHHDAPPVKQADLKFRTPEHKMEPTSRGCGLFIPGDRNINDYIACPHCGTSHYSEHIGDAVFYRLPAEQAAKVLEQWYHKLEDCADIYAKYSPNDPRTLMMAQNKDFVTARQKKGLTIYPWKNILQDTSNGSSLQNRFKAFILA